MVESLPRRCPNIDSCKETLNKSMYEVKCLSVNSPIEEPR
jgi:hypothetical protein